MGIDVAIAALEFQVVDDAVAAVLVAVAADSDDNVVAGPVAADNDKDIAVLGYASAAALLRNDAASTTLHLREHAECGGEWAG